MTGFYREISENLEQVPALLGLQLEVEGVSDSDGGGGPALVLDQESNPGNIIHLISTFVDS